MFSPAISLTGEKLAVLALFLLPYPHNKWLYKERLGF